MPSGAFRDLPAFCRVTATLRPSADSDIKIEVWLPTTGWNGKFLGVGNGGWAESIAYAIPGRSLADGLRRGYAVASTDTGHTGGQSDGSFALDHPEAERFPFRWPLGSPRPISSAADTDATRMARAIQDRGDRNDGAVAERCRLSLKTVGQPGEFQVQVVREHRTRQRGVSAAYVLETVHLGRQCGIQDQLCLPRWRNWE